MPSQEFQSFHAAQPELQLTRARAGYFITASADKIIGEAIRAKGYFEEENIDLAIARLRSLGHHVHLRTFVDVGANIGTQTIWALRCGFSSAVCVEADETNYRLLRANQVLNSVDERCRNILAAAAQENGVGELELSPSNFGDHRLRALCKQGAAEVYSESRRPVRTIATKRLESILEQVGIEIADIGLVWIDVQGSEGHVLAGAPSLVSSNVPMVVEFWPYGLERTGGYGLLRNALFKGGRKVYDLGDRVKGQTARCLDMHELDEVFSTWLRLESAAHAHFTDLLVV